MSNVTTESDKQKTVKSELLRLASTQKGNLYIRDIREAAYDLAESLSRLASELESADLLIGGHGGPLIEQHLIVCEMIELSKKLELTKYL